jgi:single-strand DNA-binding protein
MSWDINHVVLVGRLTRDPELTYTQSGAAVCRFSIAVNRTSGSRGENQEESTSFFNIVAWNKTAEICNEYLSKGKQVGVDGRLQQRRWSGSDGMKRSNVEIVANNVQFFGPARSQSGQFQDSQASSQEEKVSAKKSEDFKEEPARDPFLSELDDDEIPF